MLFFVGCTVFHDNENLISTLDRFDDHEYANDYQMMMKRERYAICVFCEFYLKVNMYLLGIKFDINTDDTELLYSFVKNGE